MKIKIKKSQLEIIQGDILTVSVGAIFCPDTINMAMSFGIAKVIHQQTKNIVYDALRSKVPVNPGQVLEVAVDGLNARYVFMAAVMGPDGEITRESVEKCMRNAFAMCKDLSVESISFPMISSTRAKIPYDTFANIMLRIIFDYLVNNDIELTVNLVIFNDEAFSKIKNNLDIIRQEYFI